jgi:hypothetical protein
VIRALEGTDGGSAIINNYFIFSVKAAPHPETRILEAMSFFLCDPQRNLSVSAFGFLPATPTRPDDNRIVSGLLEKAKRGGAEISQRIAEGK